MLSTSPPAPASGPGRPPDAEGQPVFPAAGNGLGTKRFQLAALHLETGGCPLSAGQSVPPQSRPPSASTDTTQCRSVIVLSSSSKETGSFSCKKLRHGGFFRGKRRASLRRQQSAFFLKEPPFLLPTAPPGGSFPRRLRTNAAHRLRDLPRTAKSAALPAAARALSAPPKTPAPTSG